jgi:AcrR family transcriptional regulator
LRAAALAYGLTELASARDPDLGLRALARAIGVSATALYRHFPDKDALLDALAGAGMAQLGALQARAAAAVGGGRDGFMESGFAYVRFARDNPALFRLTFSRAGRMAPGDDDPAALGQAQRLLYEGVAAMMPGEIAPAKRDVMALHAWSLVHGLAMLILDGRVAWDDAKLRQILALTFDMGD